MHTAMRNIYKEQRSSYTHMNTASQNKFLLFTDPKMHFKKCALDLKIELWKSPVL